MFQVTPAGVLTTLASFNGTNGANPQAGLVLAGSDGNFYGTTGGGGTSNNGTVFQVTPAGVLTTLANFNGTNGSLPKSGLAADGNGNFYGTTSFGGANEKGTVFKVTPAGALTTLYSFESTTGINPTGTPLFGGDGKLYGTADPMTIWRITLATAPPILTAQPQPVTVLAGTNFTLSVTATGTAPLAYQWLKNSAPLIAATNANLTLTNVNRASGGAYVVVVSNGADSVTSASVVVRVFVPQRMAVPVLLGSGQFRISFGDHDGGQLTVGDLANFELWGSTNLMNTNAWVRILDGLTLNNGQIQVEDAGSAGQPRRFYRVLER